MKRRNRLFSALLSCLLLVSVLSPNALAIEDEAETQPDDLPAETAVVVYSLDELQAAISAADDGDTITLGDRINITENCVIGDAEKQITIVPLDESVKMYLCVFGETATDVVFQNLVIDGKNLPCTYAIDIHSYRVADELAYCTFDNITVENVASTWIPITIMATSAEIKNCRFTNNTGHLCGALRIGTTAYTNITDSTFSCNKSSGVGGAINCQGKLEMTDCTINGNEAAFETTDAHAGGGILVNSAAYCKMTSCTITGNSATLGGGVAVHGETEMIDTAVYGNTGKNGADDVRMIADAAFRMSYTGSMDSVYIGKQPIGFYKDYIGNRFDANSNAIFIGEVIDCEIDSPDFGAKFVFASDLPQEPEQPETPEETPPEPTRPSHSGHHHSTPSVTPQKDETVKLCAGNAELDPDKPFALAGYGDGQLHENDPITRAQFAVLLYRSLTDDSKAILTGSTSVFTDVPKDSWYHDAVSVFASVGVLNGCNGFFRPNDNLTYGQLIAILTRFVDAKTVPMPNVSYSEHWAYRNIMTAVAYGWIQDAASVQPDRIITRSEVVALVNQIFSQS